MQLEPLLKAEFAQVLPEGADLEAVLTAIGEVAAKAAGLDVGGVVEALRKREADMPTATPEGVAFPHALLEGLDHTLLVPMLCRGGVAFREDGPVCDVIVGMIGPAARPFEHVRVLARLSRVLHTPGALDRLRSAADAAALIAALREEDGRHG